MTSLDPVSFLKQEPKPFMSELINTTPYNALRQLIVNGTAKVILVHGPSGSGKTYSVQHILKQEGYEPVEIDASELNQSDKGMAELKLLVSQTTRSANMFVRLCLVVESVRGDFIKRNTEDRATQPIVDVWLSTASKRNQYVSTRSTQ